MRIVYSGRSTSRKNFAASVSPDPERAARLLKLGLAWWVAVPLRSGGRGVGSVAIAGREGDPETVVATLEP